MEPGDRALIERLVGSPEFQRFFKGSHVVDSAGSPLIVYHSGTFNPNENPVPVIGNTGMHWGTLEAARERVAGKLIDDLHAALEVGPDPDTGRWHWETDGMSSWDLSEEGFETEEQARDDADAAISDTVDASDLDTVITPAWLSIRNPKLVPDAGSAWAKVIRKAMDEGHDGLVYMNRYEDKGSTSYVVFHPGQVKSVYNTGAFNPQNPSVLEGRRRRR